MELLPYTPEWLPEVAALYNRVLANVPHHYPVSEHRLGAVLDSALSRPSIPGGATPLLLVARNGGQTVGFAHVALDLNQPHGSHGVFCCFLYERGERKSGQALLEAAESWGMGHSVSRMATFDHPQRYPFYQFKSSYCSERSDHIHALLEANGYEKFGGEVILEWRDFDPPTWKSPSSDNEFRLETMGGKGELPNLVVRAFEAGREIGSCRWESLEETTDDPRARGWGFVAGLDIVEDRQGQRKGYHLLVHTLRQAKSLGYHHAIITTDWRNYRAFLFYSNFGFTLSDWTYRWGKAL